MRNIVPKITLFFAPLVIWIDRYLTMPFSVKKINGDHYYFWRDRIHKGMVLLTNTNGAGANLLNPSEFNHAGIYYGKGLKSAIKKEIAELHRQYELDGSANSIKKARRLEAILAKYKVEDEICYVIEATAKGVTPTNLVKFMTTKDVLKVVTPVFVGAEGMDHAAEYAIHDLGLPYDYGFQTADNAKYCFEVCIDAYQSVSFDFKFKERSYLGHRAYVSETFTDDPNMWRMVIDSNKLIGL